MAAVPKNAVSARKRGRELRRLDPASVGHQTLQALQDRDGAPIIAGSEPKASSIWHGHVMGAV
jgi:hypothetical protein